MLNQREQFFRQLAETKSLALIFNKNWTGDAVAAGLGLAQLLIKLGYSITLSADSDSKQEVLAWLPFFPFIQPILDGPKEFVISIDITQTKITDLRYQTSPERLDIIIAQEAGVLLPHHVSLKPGDFPYQAAIALGCPDLDSLGSLYQNNPDFFQQTALINLDYSTDNEGYGQLNIIDLKSPSVSEIVYQLFADQPDLIDPDIATCLLTGIIIATNNFKSANLCPQTLTAAAELISLGARREEIINQLYRNKKLDILKLWGLALSHLSTSENNKLAWTFFDYQEIKDAHFKRQDLINLVEELIGNLPALEAVIIFIGKNGDTSAFVYTLKNFDALALTKDYQGQGTKKLAQILINAPLAEAMEKVVPVLAQELSL